MAFNDTFRLSSHAVIMDDQQRVLLLKASYADFSWGLPGGALDAGETIHDALQRECMEELGQTVKILHLTGVYYHTAFNSQAFIFRCELSHSDIILSDEHTAYDFFPITSLSKVQQQRVLDCLAFDGIVKSARF